MSIPDAVRELLEQKVFAQLALVDEQGSPQVSPVWIDVRDGRVFINTEEGRHKDRLLQVGAKVAMAALDPQNPYRYAGLEGTVVERTLEGGREGIDALSKKYLDVTPYPAHREDRARVNVLIEVDKAWIHG